MIKLAIADDHQMFSEGVNHVLSQYEDIKIVAQVKDGEELLQIMENQVVDVVLLDINMVGMGGVEASRILKKRFPTVRIIILSMYKKPEIIQHLIHIGVHGYVLKDSGFDVLYKAIIMVNQGKDYFEEEVKNTLIDQYKSGELPCCMQLTKRELEILRWICKSLTSKEIADKLNISYNTVETHRKNILAKTGATNSVALMRFAVENQLV